MEEELGLKSPAHDIQGPAPSLQNSSFLSGKAEPSGEQGDDLDLSFLPDELSTQEEAGRHDDTGATSLTSLDGFVFSAVSTNQICEYEYTRKYILEASDF